MKTKFSKSLKRLPLYVPGKTSLNTKELPVTYNQKKKMFCIFCSCDTIERKQLQTSICNLLSSEILMTCSKENPDSS